ncbi:MAG: DNA-3-methyladenine glycosylase 2 family protein [Cyanobacteria bacterium P01_C01_bin.118]
MQEPLTPQRLQQGVEALVKREPSFAKVVEQCNLPPFWQRAPGFPTLIQIILEQQVSLASANSAYKRLLVSADPLSPESFLQLTDVDLKQIGFSRQKISYGRTLAHAIQEQTLNLSALEALSDQAVRDHLIRIKGIGIWTANIYLLMALRRADIWPRGDLALHVAIQQLMELPKRPTADEAHTMSLAWQPWRSVAARLLWHFYLSQRQQTYS